MIIIVLELKYNIYVLDFFFFFFHSLFHQGAIFMHEGPFTIRVLLSGYMTSGLFFLDPDAYHDFLLFNQ